MSYRDDLDALEARRTALVTEIDQRNRELDATSQLIDQARLLAKRPILDDVRVASPCPVAWDTMSGDARVRACAQCNKRVYNLSMMTREEAEAVIIAHEGQLCVTYFRRKDGTIMLDDCEVGVTRRRRRRLAAAAAGLALLATSGSAAALSRRGTAATAPSGTVPADLEHGTIATSAVSPDDGVDAAELERLVRREQALRKQIEQEHALRTTGVVEMRLKGDDLK
ncbi:MAG TPA: hypothetical protein VLX92_00800 [Kofleriaceae bacterium]|nr:hypothetical protein [Kofleriaceae bacterium]